MPYDNMGDPKNITEKNLEEAGKTAAIGKKGVIEAKKNMIALLQLQIKKDELSKPQEQY
jgi:hypothetical protein